MFVMDDLGGERITKEMLKAGAEVFSEQVVSDLFNGRLAHDALAMTVYQVMRKAALRAEVSADL